jgi:ABC-type Mn2+/Zn2+ transport system permease subunit
MDWFVEPLRYEFMQRALLACVIVGFTNGFLSAYVVLRRLALMADSLSHSLLPGLAVGMVVFGLAPAGFFAGALIAGGLVALGGTLLSHHSRIKEETAIAALYTIAFAAGILLIRAFHIRVDLMHFLFGDVLGISDLDLWTSYGISLVTLVTLVALQRPLFLAIFEPSVAQSQGVPASALSYVVIGLIVLAMVGSLQTMGVVLSLGLLVLPAAIVYLLTDSFDVMAWGGGLIGMVSAVAGLWISYFFDLGSGPTIVVLLGGLFFLAFLFSPRHGFLWKRRLCRGGEKA